MKKMLTLVLILAVASLAGAAQVWTITGSTATQTGAAGWEVNPGNTLTMVLSLSSDTASGVVINGLTDNGSNGGPIAVTGLAPIFLSNGNGLGMTGAALNALLIANSMPASSLAANDWGYIEGFSTSTSTAASLMTVTYTVGAALGSVTISAIGIDALGPDNTIKILGADEVMAPIGLNVVAVPEPITMALLGIGGLFLRRKK